MTRPPITLIADGIEHPGNARTLQAAAAMFGGDCLFRDRAQVARAWPEPLPESLPESLRLPTIAADVVQQHYTPLVALDNLPGAADIYGFGLPGGPHPALVVGNERRGIAADLRVMAACAVQIPMPSRRLNCLNVAAAAAVGLYYLSREGGGKLQTSVHPSKRRPELLLAAPTQHVELGSALRSAGAFGWDRIFLDDRAHVWFGAERAVVAEGRAAARRHRNPIHVIPLPPERHFAFAEVCVITTLRTGVPLHRARLAGGPRQLIIIPDESNAAVVNEAWQRLGQVVQFVHLDLPSLRFDYHYRLPASIALAEVARQVGRRPLDAGRTERQGLAYDSALATLIQEQGELVYLDDLSSY